MHQILLSHSPTGMLVLGYIYKKMNANLRRKRKEKLTYSSQFDTTTEQISPIELSITGVFPACVAGILYRTGPATFRFPGSTFTLTHWFDGFTQLYRFQLTQNPDDPATCKVLFNSRRQVDHLIEKVKETGRLEGITFGQKRDPCDSFFKKVKTVFESTWDKRDASMVNVGVTVHADIPGVHVGLKNSDPENATALKTLTTLTDANILKHVGESRLFYICVYIHVLNVYRSTPKHLSLSESHSKKDSILHSKGPLQQLMLQLIQSQEMCIIIT